MDTKDLIQNFLRVRDEVIAQAKTPDQPREKPSSKFREKTWSRVGKTPVESREKTLPALRGTTDSVLERSPQTVMVDTYQSKTLKHGNLTWEGRPRKQPKEKPTENQVIARSKALCNPEEFLRDSLEDSLRAFRRWAKGEHLSRKARRSLEGRLRANWAREHGFHPEGPQLFTDDYISGKTEE